jgi:hypothetical protein
VGAARPSGRSNSYRLFFPQQDHIGGVLGTGDGEGFSIRRPLKFGDVFRGEVRDLASRRAVERLHKNVIQALIADDVGHGFHRTVEPTAMALAFAGMGDKDQALVWLEKAYTRRSNSLTSLQVDPACDLLRGDARFRDLLRRVGLEQ